MDKKIRLGLIGANVKAHWAPRSHFPALLASDDFELTAVCTTKPETAEAARKHYGARLAFHDYRELVKSPEIDAVAVVVRVPLHYEPTKLALQAGKHVYTEWPLGRTTGEAEVLAALATAQRVQTAVGLQARVSPPLVYMKELIESGYIGEVMACRVSLVRDGVLQRTSGRTWQHDASLGANTLTIANGHTIDALRFVAGRFSRLSATISTQAKQWLETDTGRMVDVTSPDHVLVTGQLENGAVASVHIGVIPFAGSGYRMEVYGREGTLVASGKDSPQLTEIRLQGAQGKHALADLEIPERLTRTSAATPQGEPFNVGQMYSAFAEAIRTGRGTQPNFDTAVELHRFVDALKQSSDTGQVVTGVG